MRVFLSSFLMRGESQVIDRILECFSNTYFDTNASGTVFVSKNALYIFVYAITMLQSNLHNKENVEKMSADAFVK
jgi:Sec7-like guanine-nucleotide exchange factor